MIWLYLLLARGSFWLPPALLPYLGGHAKTIETRSVAVIVPARNEAATIADTVQSLMQQRYGGALRLIVVDDASTDGTATLAQAAAAACGSSARLTLVTAAPLPRGWTGKLWAMSQGLEAVLRQESQSPDYVLFTDADVHHDPDNVGSLVHAAEQGAWDLVSSMVTLSMRGSAEKWLMPAFVFFFLLLYPPAWVASRSSRTAAAAGGCVLVRPAALASIGGLGAIRSEIIDDCALAQAVKRSGGTVSLTLTRLAHSSRAYGSLQEIGRLVSRTAFNQLQHSYLLLAVTLVALLVTYVLPPLLLLTRRSLLMALGAAAWLLMSLAYAPMLRFCGRSLLWALTLPMISIFYAAATVHSAWQYLRGRGGAWKGRIQDVRAV